jgi:hypothetical protein
MAAVNNTSFERKKKETTHGCQAVIDGDDHQRVPHPDHSCRSQSWIRTHGEITMVSWFILRRPPQEKDEPTFCDTLSFSAGRVRSFIPAATRHHFINGAQKNTVFGPTP